MTIIHLRKDGGRDVWCGAPLGRRLIGDAPNEVNCHDCRKAVEAPTTELNDEPMALPPEPWKRALGPTDLS